MFKLPWKADQDPWARLWRECVKAHDAAWGRFYRAYAPVILKTARLWGQGRQEARAIAEQGVRILMKNVMTIPDVPAMAATLRHSILELLLQTRRAAPAENAATPRAACPACEDLLRRAEGLGKPAVNRHVDGCPNCRHEADLLARSYHNWYQPDPSPRGLELSPLLTQALKDLKKARHLKHLKLAVLYVGKYVAGRLTAGLSDHVFALALRSSAERLPEHPVPAVSGALAFVLRDEDGVRQAGGRVQLVGPLAGKRQRASRRRRGRILKADARGVIHVEAPAPGRYLVKAGKESWEVDVMPPPPEVLP